MIAKHGCSFKHCTSTEHKKGPAEKNLKIGISNYHHHHNNKTIRNLESRDLFFPLLLPFANHTSHLCPAVETHAPPCFVHTECCPWPHATSALCREGRGKRTSWNAADWPIPAHRTPAGSTSQMHICTQMRLHCCCSQLCSAVVYVDTSTENAYTFWKEEKENGRGMSSLLSPGSLISNILPCSSSQKGRSGSSQLSSLCHEIHT